MPFKRTIKQRVGAVLLKSLPISQELFREIRLEVNAAGRRIRNALNPSYHRRVWLIKLQNDLSVNIGAGPFGEQGWINLDLFKHKNVSLALDCRKTLPFREGTVVRIRCEHFLEHLNRPEQTTVFLDECLRVLKPSGLLRIVVPDLELYVKAYISNQDEDWEKLGIRKSSYSAGTFMPIEFLNFSFRQGGEHKFGYDFTLLAADLKRAGFRHVKKMQWGVSDDIHLQNDLPNHRPYSLYVEARK